MTMRYLAALLLVLPLLLTPATQAQDAPEVDPLNLYKLVGRSWTTRTIFWKRGGAATTTYSKQEVTLVHEELCTLKTSSLDKDGFAAGGDQARDVRFDAELKAASVPAKDATKTRLAIAGYSFECTLSESMSESSHEQIWRSAKYPALILRKRIVRADYVESLDLLAFNEGIPDAWTLYRTLGRKWVYRINEELTGPNPKTTYLVNEVIESTFEGAKVKTSYLDKDKKPVAGDLGDTTSIDFERATPWQRPEIAKDRDVIDGTLSAGRIKWASIEIRGKEQSEFYSKNWPGLLLKKTAKNSEMVLDEFCTGHDELRLYRTQGNYYVMRQSYRFGGRRMGDSSSYTRVEVKTVKDDQSSYQVSSYDQNMQQQYSQPGTMTLYPFKPQPFAGDEPIEERIITGAGVFQCLRVINDQKNSKYTTWTHHGLTIRTLNEGEAFTMLQEVTELKLE
jgi:hypothetical protein